MTLETIKTLNAAARTVLAAVVIGALGVAGYQGYELYQGPKLALERTQTLLQTAQTQLEETRGSLKKAEAENAAQAKRIQRLETAIGLLKVNHRLAELHVLEMSERNGKRFTTVSFVETNDEGQPIGGASAFEIEGDMVYVDYLVAKFDDKYVESADLDRSTAICLFQRIFGENQEPSEGFALDRVGTRPTAYARGGAISEFEQKIWQDFWTLANDRDKAQELGIRAAHGSAASIRVQAGKKYRVRLRSTGEFSIQPINPSAAARPEG